MKTPSYIVLVRKTNISAARAMMFVTTYTKCIRIVKRTLFFFFFFYSGPTDEPGENNKKEQPLLLLPYVTSTTQTAADSVIVK
jgi:hypothetical protein